MSDIVLKIGKNVSKTDFTYHRRGYIISSDGKERELLGKVRFLSRLRRNENQRESEFFAK